MKRRTVVWLVLWLLSGSIASHAAEPAASISKKLSLVFSLEQSFVNSPVQNGDRVGLSRSLSAIQALSARHDVYALFGCSQSDRRKLFAALDLAAALQVRFVLDAWTSETKAPPRPPEAPVSKPFDAKHGLCMSASELQMIRDRYGRYFAGIRQHEVAASNLTIEIYKSGENWFPKKSNFYPSDNYYQKRFLEEHFRFAHQNGMFVIFNDPFWLGGDNRYLRRPEVRQAALERDLADVMRRYPRTGIIMYANNEPLKTGSSPLFQRMETWPSIFSEDLLRTAVGYGLSNQSWICDRVKIPETECDPHVLARWASSAVKIGATWIQFEPYWYFFQYLRPAGDSNNYNILSNNNNRGYPTGAFMRIISSLDSAARAGR